MRGREKFNKFKPMIIFLCKIISVIPFNLRKKFLNSTRNLNGILGLTIRYILLKTLSPSCGDNVSIHPGVYIFSPENLFIGDNVSIHPMCYIDATGEINICENVSIAHATTIMSSSHNFSDLKVEINNQGVELKSVVIKENVWIGAKVTILSGVQISEGCVIAANSLVNKNVPKNSIFGGVPAKLIKERN